MIGPARWLGIGLLALAAFATTAAAAPGGVFGPPAPGSGVFASPAAAFASPAIGTLAPGTPPGDEAGALDGLNPASILAGAAEALPNAERSSSRGLSTAVNIMVVLTVVSLVPTILLMTTCFMRIVIVLALLKQALGTQQMPPSQVLLGLALIMTLLVMSPTIERINREAIGPYRTGEVTDYAQLWDRAKQPLRDFMFDQIEATGNYSSLYMVMNYRGIDTSRPETLTRASVDTLTLLPAFVLSELKVGFLMGFKIYLPFLVIDMVISAILISMSMMMLPPVLISLPFKLLLFVMVDGWQLIVGGLLQSFVVRPVAAPAVSAAWPALHPVAHAVGWV